MDVLVEFRIRCEAAGAEVGVEAFSHQQRVAAVLDSVVVPDGDAAFEKEEARDDAVVAVRRDSLTAAQDQDIGADSKAAEQAEAAAPKVKPAGRARVFVPLMQLRDIDLVAAGHIEPLDLVGEV